MDTYRYGVSLSLQATSDFQTRIAGCLTVAGSLAKDWIGALVTQRKVTLETQAISSWSGKIASGKLI